MTPIRTLRPQQFGTASWHLTLFLNRPSPKISKISKFTVNVSKQYPYLTALTEETGGAKIPWCIDSSREKKKLPVKKISFVPVKMNFLPVKKTKKNQKSAREKKKWAWKNWKMGQKVGVKKEKCPWKNPKKGQKWLSRALLIFTGKKKHCKGHSV